MESFILLIVFQRPSHYMPIPGTKQNGCIYDLVTFPVHLSNALEGHSH